MKTISFRVEDHVAQETAQAAKAEHVERREWRRRCFMRDWEAYKAGKKEQEKKGGE